MHTYAKASSSAHFQIGLIKENLSERAVRRMEIDCETYLTPSLARGSGRLEGPVPSMKPWASISTTLSTMSGRSAARVIAKAPPKPS